MRVIIIILSIILLGCTPSSDIPVINPDQVYLGYPCFDSCQSFRVGYQTAISEGFSNLDQCGSLDDARTAGCRARVQEYIYESNPEGDLRIVEPRENVTEIP